MGGERYNICNQKDIMEIKPKIALTITSCKRPEEFVMTIESLSDRLKDIHLIDTIIHYDDSSDDDARVRMQQTLEQSFDGIQIIHRRFETDSFTTNKRHMSVMNHWIDDLVSLGVDYVLHTEEDWLYELDFNITEAIKLIEHDEKCAQVGFSQKIRQFPDDINVKTFGNFWEWAYLPNRGITENLFLDTAIMEEVNIPGYWCYFINWPHFSLRPGVYDVRRIDSVGRFEDLEISFELDFAKRYAEKFVTYEHNNQICRHIGDISSYNINESER